MYIGQAAKETGTTPKAIRHYEAIGLIAAPKRLGNYRFYSDRDIYVIRLIKCAQKYGFKLTELERIVKKANVDNTFPYGEFIEAIEKKCLQIQSEINRLTERYEGLVELNDQLINQKCSC